jgi:hypothetical protein
MQWDKCAAVRAGEAEQMRRFSGSVKRNRRAASAEGRGGTDTPRSADQVRGNRYAAEQICRREGGERNRCAVSAEA